LKALFNDNRILLGKEEDVEVILGVMLAKVFT
jgi:hypothetical protein